MQVVKKVARLTGIARRHWRHPVRAVRRVRPALARRRRSRIKGGQAKRFTAFDAVVGIDRFRAPDRTVVILADPTIRREVRRWIDLFRPAAVHVVTSDVQPEWEVEDDDATFHVDETLKTINWQLKLIGPADLILNLLVKPGAEHRAMWERLFFHLKVGGWYVIDAAATGLQPFSEECAAWMSALLGAAKSEQSTGVARELSRSVGELNVTREFVLIKKRQKHWVKLRDAETNHLLTAREPGISLTELARLPGGKLECAGQIVSHESSTPMLGLETTMDYPALHLRHYQGRVAMIYKALLHTDYTILPDSFRHHLAKNPKNPKITNVSPTFARIPPSLRPKEFLPGSYYHLDSENPGHFGHLMTEVMSRLWGWHEAKAAIPDLKAAFRIRYENERDPAIERRIFSAYGIAEEDIVWIDHPVYVESVVAATPMWHNQVPHYVHPRIREVWERIGDNIIDPDAPEYPKLFVSRQRHQRNRLCRNAAAVEEFFAAHGFEIVYPELFDLSTQAGIFSKARVIAGFGGSAMFNMLFARNLSTVIVLAHEAYTTRNEHLYSAVLGPDVHYFWSPSDHAHPEGGWSVRAFYGGWEFDFARNEQALRELLANI